MDLGPVSAWVAVLVALVGAAWAIWQWRDKKTERLRAVADQIAVVTANASTQEPTSGFDADAVIVTNGSSETIYGVVVGITVGDGYSSAQDTHTTFKGQVPPGHAAAANIPPGRWLIDGLQGWAGMSKRPHPVIAFSDSQQNHWYRNGTGALRQVERSAVEWHDLHVPVAYVSPVALN